MTLVVNNVHHDKVKYIQLLLTKTFVIPIGWIFFKAHGTSVIFEIHNYRFMYAGPSDDM